MSDTQMTPPDRTPSPPVCKVPMRLADNPAQRSAMDTNNGQAPFEKVIILAAMGHLLDINQRHLDHLRREDPTSPWA
ncbi:hypothetical protein GCM10027269_28590 [Kribbella endophytica]